MSTTQAPAINMDKLNEFIGRFVTDLEPRFTRELVKSAGFTRFRRAAETPFNIVYEARP